MSFDHSVRIKVALGLMIFFALLSSLRLLMDSARFDLSSVGRDDITLYQKRFDPIRRMLPSHGAVGYLGNVNHARYWTSDATALKNWFLTQYTLAPVVVSISSAHKLTIINSREVSNNPNSSDNGAFTIQDLGNGNKVFDFGNGLKLLSSE